jgi:hypothetical protein
LPRDQGARLVPIENWDDASHVVVDSVDQKDTARVKKIVAATGSPAGCSSVKTMERMQHGYLSSTRIKTSSCGTASR